MTKTPEEFKGEVKESVGKLTENHDLENEGKMDQAKGKFDEYADRVADKAKGLADSIRDKLNKKE